MLQPLTSKVVLRITRAVPKIKYTSTDGNAIYGPNPVLLQDLDSSNVGISGCSLWQGYVSQFKKMPLMENLSSVEV